MLFPSTTVGPNQEKDESIYNPSSTRTLKETPIEDEEGEENEVTLPYTLQ